MKNKYFKLTTVLFLSCLWVLLEYARNYFLTGFPWNLLGYSQWNNLFFIQIADITGVYGVSFFVIFLNIYITFLIDFFVNKKSEMTKHKEDSAKNNIKDFFKNTIAVILIVLAVFLYGFYRLKIFDINQYKKESIKFCVLQGNIDQYKKFDAQYFDYIRNSYTNLINSKQDDKIDIFVWPETAYPLLYPNNIDYFFKDIKVNSKHIVGVFNEDNKKFYNSAAFVSFSDNNFKLLDIYSKIHLVPFGEYFPFRKYLAKIIPAVGNLGGVENGKKYQLFRYGNNLLAINICFESLFPNLVRKFVKRGSTILLNISNDGWYLKTSAPYQHFSFNIFRAVENRRCLVRSANTGISAIISPFGEVLHRTEIYQNECFDYVVQGVDYLSFYSRYGDVFFLMCLFYMLGFIYFIKFVRK